MAAFHLVALIPPGSVQAEIGRLQQEIFRRCGLASSLAFPPLIPVRFIGPCGSERALLEQLDAAASAPWRMVTGKLSRVEGHLYLGVDSKGTWAVLADRARERCGEQPDALFPVAEGFFLGCREASPGTRDDAGAEAPAVSFSSCAIAVLGIEAPRGRAQWWRELYWEVLEQRPLRGRRES
jgi:hypothetical protein